ncbi:hypothetical protein OOT46_09345 [Aquabacterium sp. A7-Y]|uniref:hypothetical protein n=1 Tax=Aquabacterium sp. A7-Y TaxID=1349605 RepID=UPI00223CDFD0|nr:hypothetical protein [Aquabacterium sp. A7-Y]MCW7538051.1 hypothetical protein [Aquabacterium sp. A7-Y]
MNLVYLINGAPFTRSDAGGIEIPVHENTLAGAQSAICAAYKTEGYEVRRIEVLDWSGPMKLLAVYAYAEPAYDNPPALLLFTVREGAEVAGQSAGDAMPQRREGV